MIVDPCFNPVQLLFYVILRRKGWACEKIRTRRCTSTLLPLLPSFLYLSLSPFKYPPSFSLGADFSVPKYRWWFIKWECSPWLVCPLTAIHYSLLLLRVIIFPSDPTAAPRHGRTPSLLFFQDLVYHAITALYAYQDSLHLRAIPANIITPWDYEFCIRLGGSFREPSAIPYFSFLTLVFAPSSRSLSFLSVLLVSTSGRGTAKIRAYVNVRNLVLVKLRICACLFARQCFRLRMEEDFKLKYVLSRIIIACWKINPIRKLRNYSNPIIMLNLETIRNLLVIVIIIVYAFLNKMLSHLWYSL